MSKTLWKSLAVAALVGLLAAPAVAEDMSAVYVMSDNLGDHGFNDSAAEGFHRAEKEGVKVRLLQASPSDPGLWRQNLEAVSNAGNWKVIFTGPNMHDNLAAVAPQHPDQKYVFFDDELAAPNVLSVKYAQNEGSYLAGALAAAAAGDKATFPLSTGEKKIAIVAGMDLPVIQDFIVGFKQGAAAIDPATEVQVIFIGSFNDAQKAYDLTKGAIENGANVVYNVAGPAGLGILKAAADLDRYAIGVDSNQNDLHPKNILASMLKQIGNSIYDSIGQVKAGTAPFGTLVIYGLKNDGVGLVYNDALVPDAVRAKIDAVKAKVVAGEVSVDSAFKK
ncbi:BMP family ABC transporter substrate-binding protein [Kaistia algarum]|uniref:BMP family lipoprotein n=1 Tax=Kaistia algarum TaxID=2083279 RepID=UPI000CE8AF65|nr:BMP family ABC transporter substrate-binding protein [Kaistia algarum]MCX5512924.1 BMP family ABC transporter substrate-binding protein [Kaistia algarum]PPE81588.1 BMP family ABC transporter substrate-binding protein [Kaistia algarum]